MGRRLQIAFLGVAIALAALAYWASRPAIDLSVSGTGDQNLPQAAQDPSIARAVEAVLSRPGSAIDAALILKDGHVTDAFGAIDQPMDLASVRKGILSLLFGIAFDRGLISADATLADLGIDESQTPLTRSERTATITDLLASRSGVYIPSGAETEWMRENRPARGSAQPGSQFFYNNWDFNVAGVVFAQQTGLSIGEALDQWLARPLGMQDFHPAHVRVEAPPRSTEFGRYQIFMSTRDLARIGLLIQNDGQWAGKQLVPTDWIDRIKTKRSSLDPADPNADGFSLSWWIDGRNGNLYHEGWGGQYLYLDAATNTVIVTRTDNGLRNGTMAWFFLFGVQGEFEDIDAIRMALSP